MKTIQDQLNEPDGLRRYLVPWGIYIDGARAMLMKLHDHGLIEEARAKTGMPHAKGDDLVYNKAIIDLLLDPRTTLTASCRRPMTASASPAMSATRKAN